MTQLLSSTEIMNLVIRLYFVDYRLPGRLYADGIFHCPDTPRAARFFRRRLQ